MELSAAAARLDSNCCMLYSEAPGVLAQGMDDCSCLLISSSEKRIGRTQLLYQEQDLHCTKACASSRMPLIPCFALPFFWFYPDSVQAIMDKYGRSSNCCFHLEFWDCVWMRVSYSYSVSSGIAVVMKVRSSDTVSSPDLFLDLIR